MERSLRFLFPAILIVCMAGGCATGRLGMKGGKACRASVVIDSVQGDYDDVWNDLKAALTDRGLVISSVSHVGEMIDRTGRALGRTRKVFARGNVMEFCSAVVSRDMLERNAHLIAFCPYQIMVYSLPDDPRKIFISYRRPIWNDSSDQAVLNEVEDLVSGIIRDVMEEYRP